MSETTETVVEDEPNLAAEALTSDSADVSTDEGSQADASQVQDGISQEPAPQDSPAVDYEAEFQRREFLGAAYSLGIDPSRYAPEQLPHVVQAAYQQREQQIAYARQIQSDPGYQEYLRTRGQAQGAAPTQGNAQGSAPAAPEPVDPFKALQEAFTEPTPPPYLAELVAAGHLIRTRSGRIEAADGNPGKVHADELAAINKYAADKEAFESKRSGEGFNEALKQAIAAAAKQEITQTRQAEQEDQFLQQFGSRYQSAAFDPAGNLTPYGSTMIAAAAKFRKAGMSKAEAVHYAHQAAVGAIAPQLMQQREQMWASHLQQYQQPQFAPQQAPAQQPGELPQRTPNSFLQAAHAASGSGEPAAAKPRRPRNSAELRNVTFGAALAAMPDDPE